MKRAGAGGALRDRAGLGCIIGLREAFARTLAMLTDDQLRCDEPELACPACREPLRVTSSFSAGAVYSCSLCNDFGRAESLLEAA